ncbi:MAG: hypothetical protein HRU32_08005 [Rhodobacteraceae bacterium]|nr:hypothetical protein [Paracoccaceae bacterium]
MKTTLLTGLLLIAAGMAQAACYGDYKAKRDDPLQLHYGVLQLSDGACRDASRAEAEARARVQAAGWQFLTLVSTFDDSGLAQRKDSAAEFYLRF